MKTKFNIFVTWSTSLIDALKTFKSLEESIGDLKSAYALFLNDFSINRGTGNAFSGAKDDGGEGLSQEIIKRFNLEAARSRTFTQSGELEQWSPKLPIYTEQWKNNPSAEKAEDWINEFAERFKTEKNIGVQKLAVAINDNPKIKDPRHKLRGVHIPVQSFAKFCDKP